MEAEHLKNCSEKGKPIVKWGRKVMDPDMLSGLPGHRELRISIIVELIPRWNEFF